MHGWRSWEDNSLHGDATASVVLRAPRRLRRSRLPKMEFKMAPTGSAVIRVLRAVGVMYLVVPLFALAAVFFRAQVRSPLALEEAAAVFAAAIAMHGLDLFRLRKGEFDRFTPTRAFVEVCLGIGVFALVGVGLGLRQSSFLLLPVLPFLATALMGDNVMMGSAWLVLVAALGLETAVQLPLGDAAWLTLLFAGTAAVIALMIDGVVRGSIHGLDRNHSLAALATYAGTLRDWPDGLAPIAHRLAQTMDVDRYAILTRRGPHAPVDRVFSWPESDWPAWSELGDLPVRALSRTEVVRNASLLATPAFTSSAGIVVVCPFRSLLHSPVDTGLTATVAGLLAAMFDRTRLISGLVDMANTDELTGIANRRRLFDGLALEMVRARRSDRTFSVAMLDLDHFKAYNDRYGHGAGDDLLRLFSERMVRRIRGQDLLARYGGEEFCLVLPETDTEGALRLIESVRASGAAEDWSGRSVTFSAGIATWNGFESAEELVLRADANLYDAKESGRDRVVAS